MQIRLVTALLALSLTGCTGALSIWGVNVPLPGQGNGDDDDDDAPNLDFTQYEGTELINLDWTQQAEGDGHADCHERFDAFGGNSTIDDQNLCPTCDEIWALTLAAEDPEMPCLNQGSGLQVAPNYIRRVGIEFTSDIDFRYWRNRGDSDNALEAHGIGAFQGVEFTWSGVDGFSEEYAEAGFTLFFSGEGEF